jgi:hypothetical protein
MAAYAIAEHFFETPSKELDKLEKFNKLKKN